MTQLTDPAYTVPPPGPPGPVGTMAWLRATVSRFAEGETHARRRALIEARLRALDPAALRAAAALEASRATRRGHAPSETDPPVGDVPLPYPPVGDVPLPYPPVGDVPLPYPPVGDVPLPYPPVGDVPLPYLPVAVLAAATGTAPHDVAAVVAAVRVVAAAYHPGTSAPGADAALTRLLALLPPGEPEAVAQHVALLVQACEATALLVRGGLERPLEDVLRDEPPVKATRRLDPHGRVVVIDLAGRPFGEGPRACPGAEHALALAAGVLEGAR